jgi:hypothetical protein
MPELIKDVTEEYPSSIKAEQRGKDILILRRLEKPIKTWSRSPLFHYELEYRWLSDSSGVLGNEFSYFTKKEINPKKSLKK